ncbi:MAG: DVU0298 family protein [Candidatus Zixiibacteriota bacterium]
MNISRINPAGSRGRQRKAIVKDILMKRDFRALVDWYVTERMAVRTLSSLLFETDPLVCMRAAEALGRVTPQEYKQNPERVTQLLRRLFWQLNDESGNLGWFAPQAIAEILANIPALIEEHGRVLVSFLPEEPFETGVRWGLARIAAVKPGAFEGTAAAPLLIRSLDDSDKDIMTFSLFALGHLGVPVEKEKLVPFLDDPHEIDIYDWTTGDFYRTSASELSEVLIK